MQCPGSTINPGRQKPYQGVRAAGDDEVDDVVVVQQLRDALPAGHQADQVAPHLRLHMPPVLHSDKRMGTKYGMRPTCARKVQLMRIKLGCSQQAYATGCDSPARASDDSMQVRVPVQSKLLSCSMGSCQWSRLPSR